ncbi:unnamed protein product [Polarella glacialis]|uniref:Uncharacterized protein n=1 Tax=Polarella glacialis TaxID=89957 RepID=A0A813I2Q9_POLGL|nr:unnamed protein product [Polarella glacialis]
MQVLSRLSCRPLLTSRSQVFARAVATGAGDGSGRNSGSAQRSNPTPTGPIGTGGRAGARATASSSSSSSSSSGASGAYGSHFWRVAEEVAKNEQSIRQSKVLAAGPPPAEETLDPEGQTRKQIQRLFQELPGHTSASSAFLLHAKEQLEPKVVPPLNYSDFEKLYRDERQTFFRLRRNEVGKRRRMRRDHARLNTGYKEEEDVYEAEEEEFTDAWRQSSIVEDCWKAEYNQQLHYQLKKDIPERQRLAARTDRVADVVAGALRTHYAEQNRPVLTHELADFENPYMMKRSALERLLHERCVRNQLDERVLPRLLDRQSDLVKLRAEAALPPEVLEPLAAFRGDTRWNFNVRERLGQKLSAAEQALEAIVGSSGAPDVQEIVDTLPENVALDPSADQVPGLHHPWRNHVGFESAVPRGVAGGTKFGQPMATLQEQVLGLRYPTLQRVAHTLPSDPKWRAHVVRTIRVLERSKDWDFQSKLTAVNKLKEIYDQLKPSDVYTSALDEKLPVNRVPSHLKRKFARDAQYVRTFPKHFLKKKSFYRYRPSLTATAPLKKNAK